MLTNLRTKSFSAFALNFRHSEKKRHFEIVKMGASCYSEGLLFQIYHKVLLFRKLKLGLIRFRIRIRNNKPYALFGITKLWNNKPSE